MKIKSATSRVENTSGATSIPASVARAARRFELTDITINATANSFLIKVQKGPGQRYKTIFMEVGNTAAGNANAPTVAGALAEVRVGYLGQIRRRYNASKMDTVYGKYGANYDAYGYAGTGGDGAWIAPSSAGRLDFSRRAKPSKSKAVLRPASAMSALRFKALLTERGALPLAAAFQDAIAHTAAKFIVSTAGSARFSRYANSCCVQSAAASAHGAGSE